MLARRHKPHSQDAAPSVQFMSDLHLERVKYDFEITKDAPILLLAGDIGRFCDEALYRAFLAKQCSQFDKVLLIAGNHEFYGSSREEGLAIAQNFVEDETMCGKLHFLNRTRFDIPNSSTTILGCTLHSHIAADYTRLTNDFNCIKNWRVRDHNAEHERDLKWLQITLAEITSHPTHTNSNVSQCFCSNALEQMASWKGNEQVTDWKFGHTHWNAKFLIGAVLVQSNQYCNDSTKLSWWQKKTLYRPFDMKAKLRV
ncbi:hypothetical protein CKM354_000213400 [Cercospora kikuchii]|uniref:Calcineurin-like phosphoesterase domain-containing protein n=1 Tax=Cercospora kikuchii TaxID=84275 RepID=A0A9P3FDE5_9PEZI|nr:uncharacterized protein CKM354_000213400 [Cercospora kikuchii]GIZ38729.1 hypothetical protein CKM354_000213400 [Cercospora kikuchii]